ncbi:MAG: HlyD family efflux transporter periplasmic adaptor subunit [Halieaceae bacterium]|jgi:membrane fusion protein|nr:HlyD family efflux transporter periplasmic adaptor subunit [Halieaceae bacterium]
MSQELFRAQVVERQADRLHGDVLLLPRVSYSVILALVTLWLVVAGYWLAHNTYARKETVRGYLQPASGVTRVYADGNGIIKRTLVAEGDAVVAGQPLVVINGDRQLASGDRLETLLLDEYSRQQGVLTQQVTRNQTVYWHRDEGIDQQITAARQNLKLVAAQLASLTQRQALLSEQVGRYRSLSESRYIASTDLEAAIHRELALQSERQTLLGSQINLRNRIEQLQIERLLLPQEQADTADSLDVRLSEIAQRIAQLHGRRARIISASRSGIVHNLQAMEGQQAQPDGVPLLTLVPRGVELVIQLLVPVRAAGFIKPGQSLEIRYDAFPYQKFGLYGATVTAVSESVQLPHEALNIPIALPDAVYRVTASVNEPGVLAYGQSFALKPGMTLSADIKLSERSLVQWLLEPIYSLRGRL